GANRVLPAIRAAAEGSAADLAQDEAGGGVLVAVEVGQVDGEVGPAGAVGVTGAAPGGDLAAAERGQERALGTAAREQAGGRGRPEVPGLAGHVPGIAEVGDGRDVAADRG